MTIFTGSCVALSTPFTEDGVNYTTLEQLIEYQIEREQMHIGMWHWKPPTMTLQEAKFIYH